MDLTHHIDQDLHVAENGVVLKIALEEAKLAAAIPQVQHQVTKKSNIHMLHII